MATPTYELIDSQVLSTSAASVTFSSLPATYRDLKFIISAKAVEATGVIRMRLNGDSGANYNYVSMSGNGSATHSGSASGFNQITLSEQYNNITTSNFNLIAIDFLDYSVTDKHKSMLIRTNESSLTTQALAARYASTSVVSSILLYPGGFTNFAAGSTFYLYGIAS